MKPQFKVPLPKGKQKQIFQKSKGVSKTRSLTGLKLAGTIILPVSSKKEVNSWASSIFYAQKKIRRRFTYRTVLENGTPHIKIWRVT
jgi:hypothetical protein